MTIQTINSPLSAPAGIAVGKKPVSLLKQEYQMLEELFNIQPAAGKQFFERQASQITPAYLERHAFIRFAFPDKVTARANEPGQISEYPIPKNEREQSTNRHFNRLLRKDPRQLFRQRLTELELSTIPGVALAARLLRYTLAVHLVKKVLPEGRAVIYSTADGDTIPSLPVDNNEVSQLTSADKSTMIEREAASEASVEGQAYSAPALRFYLPKWVAFDDDCSMLVNSNDEAYAMIGSMSGYLNTLHEAVSLAPYIVTDDVYQQKRYGMLGQLLNQGRAMANYEIQHIIERLHARIAQESLNRGLSLSLPYFDDQALTTRSYDFEIIPEGLIMFVPALVVRSARREQMKVAQDTTMSVSTRKHLIDELQLLEESFKL